MVRDVQVKTTVRVPDFGQTLPARSHSLMFWAASSFVALDTVSMKADLREHIDPGRSPRLASSTGSPVGR